MGVAEAGAVTVRTATEADLDQLAAFEVQIARISFGADAITDPAVHRERLAAGLRAGGPGMFVACAQAKIVGWLWLVPATNFVTGARYGNFRSLAVAEQPRLPTVDVADVLWRHALQYAQDQGLTEIVGHVHVRNAAMRVLYRRYGFAPTRLTLRLLVPD
jgi:ribosomal protein S18 acetylase RimI-like enzyme